MKILEYIFIKPLLVCCYGLSFLSERDKNVWVFGSTGYHFRDNSKYLFLHTVNNHPEITAVWISRSKTLVNDLKSKGYQAEYYMSLRGIKRLLQANLYISEAGLAIINFWFSGGAKNVNLWHGIPLKKIGVVNKRHFFPEERTLYNVRRWAWSRLISLVERSPDFLLVTSNYYKPVMSESFVTSEENIFICGQPRNDIFFDDVKCAVTQDIKKELDKITNVERNKNILYMPTFRDSGGDSLVLSGLDFSSLNSFLLSLDTILWIKLHPVEFAKQNNNIDNYSNIKLVNALIDPYPILSHMDILVTDYSSIYFDYLLLNKPIIFFAFDLDEYLQKNRDMNFVYSEMITDIICETQDDLEQRIKYFISGNEINIGKYSEVLNKVYEPPFVESSKRIFKELVKRYK